MEIDLGCGPNKRNPDAVGVDIRDYGPVDVVTDIESGLPFDDGSVSKVYAYSILEHVDDLPYVMDEIHRVCEDRAVVEGKVPHWKDRQAYVDPTHKQLFDERTFHYWTSTYPHLPTYWPGMFKVNANRVWRLRWWRARPIKFKLVALK